MTTIGWLLILCSGLVFRAVARGRVMNMTEDLSDAFLAIVNGDTSGLAEVLARSGADNAPSSFDIATPVGNATTNGITGVANDINGSMVSQAVALGKAAKGYRLGATGPDYYDCSGLIWRASQKLGYKGPRFVTSTVQAMPGFHQVDKPVPGDIVLWPAHHMGVYVGANQMYSAQSVRSGIGFAAISTFRPDHPIYVRYTGK